MKTNERIVLYMNDGVPCGTSHSIREAYNLLQECKVQDKRLHCKGVTYYFEHEEETEDVIYYQEVKIYKRNSVYYMKGI